MVTTKHFIRYVIPDTSIMYSARCIGAQGTVKWIRHRPLRWRYIDAISSGGLLRMSMKFQACGVASATSRQNRHTPATDAAERQFFSAAMMKMIENISNGTRLTGASHAQRSSITLMIPLTYTSAAGRRSIADESSIWSFAMDLRARNWSFSFGIPFQSAGFHMKLKSGGDQGAVVIVPCVH